MEVINNHLKCDIIWMVNVTYFSLFHFFLVELLLFKSAFVLQPHEVAKDRFVHYLSRANYINSAFFIHYF